MHDYFAATLLAGALATGSICAQSPPPNVVVILFDDLGYGDLGCYGHPLIKTPRVDRLAAEGVRFTDFYATASMCTPTRSSLLTGRYPLRTGMCNNSPRVIYPANTGGLPQSELTLAEALRSSGYRTGLFGKWHLGHQPQHMPNLHGFDTYTMIPYSHDMSPLPLIRNGTVLAQPPVLSTLTQRFAEEAIGFIQANPSQPFFLYLAFNYPHTNLFPSSAFLGTSAYGLYGDVVEELDFWVGKVIDTLTQLGLDQNTVVFCTSDNGPNLSAGGSAGGLLQEKGYVHDGGVRVPFIARWPGHFPAGVVTSELGCTMDIFTTAIALAGSKPKLPTAIDGLDLQPVLFGTGPSPRTDMFFYRETRLVGMRWRQWKAYQLSQPLGTVAVPAIFEPPELYDIVNDPMETTNVAANHPGVLAQIARRVRAHRDGMVAGPTRF